MLFNKERVIYLIIITVLLGIMGYILFIQTTPDYVKKYENEIETLDKKVDSVLGLNNDLIENIKSLNYQIDSLNIKIISKTGEIIRLKNKTNEKVIDVDNFNDDELIKFFTERYKGFDKDTIH